MLERIVSQIHFSTVTYFFCCILIDFLKQILVPAEIVVDQCNPSPCGSNSNCRTHLNQAVCSCLDNYVGSPPYCRPECVRNDECSFNLACINLKCVNPCSNLCSESAVCNVINHNPVCSCKPGFEGNPLKICYKKRNEIIERDSENPCKPNPCGPFAECRNINNVASCSCYRYHIGLPPNCKPECLVNSECSATKACVNMKCINPCIDSCGFNAQCKVLNHIASCYCPNNFSGNPFKVCYLVEKNPVVTINGKCLTDSKTIQNLDLVNGFGGSVWNFIYKYH